MRKLFFIILVLSFNVNCYSQVFFSAELGKNVRNRYWNFRAHRFFSYYELKCAHTNTVNLWLGYQFGKKKIRNAFSVGLRHESFRTADRSYPVNIQYPNAEVYPDLRVKINSISIANTTYYRYKNWDFGLRLSAFGDFNESEEGTVGFSWENTSAIIEENNTWNPIYWWPNLFAGIEAKYSLCDGWMTANAYFQRHLQRDINLKWNYGLGLNFYLRFDKTKANKTED